MSGIGGSTRRVSRSRESDRLARTPDGKLANWNSPRPTRRKPGRQRQYSNHAIETTVTLGLVFGLASRQTEGFLRSLLSAPESGTTTCPTTARSRGARRGWKGCFLREANREARPPPHRQQRSFSARRPVAHSAESQGLPQAALAVDEQTSDVVACELTSKRARDASRVASLVGQIRASHRLAQGRRRGTTPATSRRRWRITVLIDRRRC